MRRGRCRAGAATGRAIPRCAAVCDVPGGDPWRAIGQCLRPGCLAACAWWVPICATCGHKGAPTCAWLGHIREHPAEIVWRLQRSGACPSQGACIGTAVGKRRRCRCGTAAAAALRLSATHTHQTPMTTANGAASGGGVWAGGVVAHMAASSCGRGQPQAAATAARPTPR